MVERYFSRSQPGAAPTAQSDMSGLRTLVDVGTGIARQVGENIDRREQAMEVAALNSARLELETQGSQLAADLQKDRVAGDGYVADLTEARKKLKTDIWAKLPKRIQGSQRAQAAWDQLYTADEISARRQAGSWQMAQEESFAVKTIDDGVNAMTAKIEANPDSVQAQYEGWKRGLALYSGILPADKLAEAEKIGEYQATMATVKGLANLDRFGEAETVIEKTAERFSPQERTALRTSLEGIQRDKMIAANLAEQEFAKGQKLAANRIEIDILYGKVSEPMILQAARDGKISENDVPALIRAKRTFDNSILADAKMSPEEKALHTARSGVYRSEVMAMPADMLLSGPQSWAQSDKDRWAAMSLSDQSAVLEEITKMKTTGQTSNAIASIKEDLLAQARMTLPKNWTLSGARQNSEEVEFQGILYRLAERESKATGGKPILAQRARELVAEAYREAGKPKSAGMNSPAPAGVVGRLFDASAKAIQQDDPQGWADVRRTLQERTGRMPTDEQVAAIYMRMMREGEAQ